MYISREAVMQILERNGLTNGARIGRHSGKCDIAEELLQDIPAADVVEVVRCKDCKCGYLYPGTDFVLCNKPYVAPRDTHNANWYCADGKRKEDAT